MKYEELKKRIEDLRKRAEEVNELLEEEERPILAAVYMNELRKIIEKYIRYRDDT